MNSFTDGKPIEQSQPAPTSVLSPKPKASPRYGVIGFIIIVLILGYLVYDLQSSKKQLKESQTQMMSALEKKLDLSMDKTDASLDRLKSDFEVIRARLNVSQRELDDARAMAARLKAEQEKSVQQLHAQISQKADTQQLSAFKEEASSQFGKVNQDVTAVKTDVDATKKDLETARRELVDVRDTLSQQIARNHDELQQLRLKGERNFYEFDINKKNNFQLVGDVKIGMMKTNPKKKKYDVRIVVDDNSLEKKDRTVNEPVQFLVGRTKLRYELVVNAVDKDRIVGYLSVPKDKGLSAEYTKTN
ncbi:MAG TPA: hypothetical protein VMW38_07410 [Terriglobia bacterium]|nr:hypothetical protein [Terriglobia bacterium]